MGGIVNQPKALCKVWVFYKRGFQAEGMKTPIALKVRFEWLTECFFASGLVDAAQYEIKSL